MIFPEHLVPTRAEILEHSNGGNIYELDIWLESLNLPVGVKETIYSDLESYAYTGEDE